MNVLEQFKEHARACSYHYADDTCKEWGLAAREKREALRLFDINPELQAEMREIMNGELWANEFKRERP